ncbi:MAG TPA: zf-HC2 domain-containing protein [Acidobacteriota bacterium]|nr:zf-HC2 domain-containing protein [Acidobacteriota bacterium]
MTCQETREKIHEYLDGELAANQAAVLELHLGECDKCRDFWEGLIWVKQALAVRERLPVPAQEQVWNQVHFRAHYGWPVWLQEQWDRFRTYWRDLDRLLLWSKLSAIPVTLGFFVMVLMQFPLVQFQHWTYPAFEMRRMPSSVFTEPLMTQVMARHTHADIDEIWSAAWKIPYEDSLSLVAQITPAGHAEIDQILKYPKNQDLLAAVDDSLRSTRFQSARNIRNPLVIYSFQKIDVYSDLPGL